MSSTTVTRNRADRNAAKAPKLLNDDQLDRVVGGARPASGKPIIIVGG